ncbi:MAG: hypothetical protein L7R66_03695 [Candidatus Thalassarchaeaceae archaeon]|nr:hypothetical protein [Candidatus Thalassarchaeaceae archaeon]
MNPFLTPEKMSEWVRSWRPEALPQIENSITAPKGFDNIKLSGKGPLSAFSCVMIEPSEMGNSSDWITIISELKAWGQVPASNLIQKVSISENERGPLVHLSAKEEWIAEFLPWGSDGLLRRRSNSYPNTCDLPCGGYSWEGSDVILIRKKESKIVTSREILSDALVSGDQDKADTILRDCGKQLGSLHSFVWGIRVTPPDPKRWNSRLAKIEDSLHARSIWRAPHSRDSDCMLAIGDVRLDDFRGDTIRIGRPRLSDALCPPDCGFPAIRDLASLAHDLSRLHYNSGTQLDIVGLRLSLIGGWRETAPSKWSSKNVFYSHRGGLAIWEYEQCLLDVIEATSHQSGAPQPAVGLIEYVPSFQKKMFNNRTIGALSLMTGFFGATSLLASFPLSFQGIIMPSLCLVTSIFLMRTFRRMSPPPEISFNRLV